MALRDLRCTLSVIEARRDSNEEIHRSRATEEDAAEDVEEAGVEEEDAESDAADGGGSGAVPGPP